MKRLKKIYLSFIFLTLLKIDLSIAEESFIPDPPSLNATNYILMDARTGKVLAEKEADAEMEPASITKIMTGYVIADQVSQGFVNLEDEVFVSQNCWKKGGSRMFIQEGANVVLSDLVKGMVVQSGNDASCAIAEHVAGSEGNFVNLMMRYVVEMGLKNTNFTNVTGWPELNHYSSARDLAILSKKLIYDFPEHYSLYKERWFTFNDIKQRNRNSLLWQDDSIDGIKTGHTESAGYCLVSSGERNETRLIAITLNSTSERSRLTDNRRLLDYGFRYFRTKKIISKAERLTEEQVWGGKLDKVGLVAANDIYLTLPPKDFRKVKSFISLSDYLVAPIAKNQEVGEITLLIEENALAKESLLADKQIDSLSVFGLAWANIKLFVYKFLMEDDI